METKGKILSNLIIRGKEAGDKRDGQFKQQQDTQKDIASKISSFDQVMQSTTSSIVANQTQLYSMLNPKLFEISHKIDKIDTVNNHFLGVEGKMDKTLAGIVSTITTQIDDLKGKVDDLSNILYQPVTITDPDGKKWTIQREKPNNR